MRIRQLTRIVIILEENRKGKKEDRIGEVNRVKKKGQVTIGKKYRYCFRSKVIEKE